MTPVKFGERTMKTPSSPEVAHRLKAIIRWCEHAIEDEEVLPQALDAIPALVESASGFMEAA